MISPLRREILMPDSPGKNEPVTVSLDVVWQGSSGKQDAHERNKHGGLLH